MRVLIDKVRKYYDKAYDLNCAETMLYAANEEYGLKLSKETLKSVAAFGGGMGVEEMCGAITGSLAVIGIMYTKDRAHESDKVKLLAKEFIESFRHELGYDNCKVLKKEFRTEEERCSKMEEAAAYILEDVIKNNSYSK